MAVVDALTRAQTLDALRERVADTRRRLDYAKAWLLEIDGELAKIDEHLRALDP